MSCSKSLHAPSTGSGPPGTGNTPNWSQLTLLGQEHSEEERQIVFFNINVSLARNS